MAWSPSGESIATVGIDATVRVWDAATGEWKTLSDYIAPDEAVIQPLVLEDSEAFAAENGSLWVKDLKSVNGTYLRVRAAEPLEHGDQIRVGQQALTFSLRPDEPLDEGAGPPAAAPPGFAAGAEAEAGGSKGSIGDPANQH